MVNKTYLICTAVKETWPDNKETIFFLGEWCKSNDWEKYRKDLECKVIPYHWDDRGKLFKDYQYLIDQFEKVFLPAIVCDLNRIHKTSHNDTFWRIFVGVWLGFFIQVVFDRYCQVKYALQVKPDLVFIQSGRSWKDVLANGMQEFNQKIVTDEWNQVLYEEILKFLSANAEPIPASFNLNNQEIVKTDRKSLFSRFLHWQSKIFVKSEEAYIQSDYLPVIKSIQFQLSLGQLPRVRRTQPLPNFQLDINKRNLSLNLENSSEFSTLVSTLLWKFIPKVYLEGFESLETSVRLLNWPDSPKFIFTSAAHTEDDLFKYYAAKKSCLGSKLVIGQHGGHYGIGKWSFLEYHETKIATKYLTWGWNDAYKPNILPAFALKLVGNKYLKYNHKGIALLVVATLPKYSYWMYSTPVAGQWLDYFTGVNIFLSKLPAGIFDKINLRLSPHDFGWDHKERWKKEFPTLVTSDSSSGSIQNTIHRARIYISTYNATTYLESFAWNVPTIMFWDPNQWEIRESARPFFDILEKAKVFHRDPKSAARHLENIWDDVDSWWLSASVQDARNIFCKQYVKQVESPLKFLKNTIIS